MQKILFFTLAVLLITPRNDQLDSGRSENSVTPEIEKQMVDTAIHFNSKQLNSEYPRIIRKSGIYLLNSEYPRIIRKSGVYLEDVYYKSANSKSTLDGTQYVFANIFERIRNPYEKILYKYIKNNLDNKRVKLLREHDHNLLRVHDYYHINLYIINMKFKDHKICPQEELWKIFSLYCDSLFLSHRLKCGDDAYIVQIFKNYNEAQQHKKLTQKEIQRLIDIMFNNKVAELLRPTTNSEVDQEDNVDKFISRANDTFNKVNADMKMIEQSAEFVQ